MLITTSRRRIMQSGSWRTRLLKPAVVGGGGQTACVFWALLLLHAR